jgi:hypothetical protein
MTALETVLVIILICDLAFWFYCYKKGFFKTANSSVLPRGANVLTDYIKTRSGLDWILTFSNGTQYIGSCTVWSYFPSGESIDNYGIIIRLLEIERQIKHKVNDGLPVEPIGMEL